MLNTSILVIEDTVLEAQVLCAMLEKNGYTIAGVASNLQDALDLFHTHKPDITIIDVMLNGKSEGLTFAKTIHANPCYSRPFLFLTGLTDRTTFEAAKATMPFGYLIKPFNEFALQYALELAMEQFVGSSGVFATGKSAFFPQHESFFVKKGNSLYKVPLHDILYLEIDGKYCNIITNESRYLVLQPLIGLLDILPANMFVRVHRNYVINFNRITELNIKDNYLLLSNNRQIEVSRRYKEILLKMLNPLK